MTRIFDVEIDPTLWILFKKTKKDIIIKKCGKNGPVKKHFCVIIKAIDHTLAMLIQEFDSK